MSILEWYLADTESGKKSHLTETEAYIFCAPFWGKVTKSTEYEGQTSYKGKPLCLRCEKVAMKVAAKAIARQRGDEASALWTLYQTANGGLKLSGRGQKPAEDPEPKSKKKLPANMREFPVSASA